MQIVHTSGANMAMGVRATLVGGAKREADRHRGWLTAGAVGAVSVGTTSPCTVVGNRSENPYKC
eukprot:SAG11_NODE_14279_length_618_cov_1.886320_1_plen_63_part_01